MKVSSSNLEPINEFPTEPIKLIECPEGCGRKFNEKVL